MPWPLDSSKPFDLLGRIKHPKKVLDLGCGKNDSPISKQVRDLPCEVLVSIDLWKPYLLEIKNLSFSTKYHQVLHIDITQAPTLFPKDYFDLCLCLDSIEHLEKELGIELLKSLPGIAKEVLIWIPIGSDPVGEKDGNQYQTHKATWEVEDLTSLGYADKVFPRVHTKSPPVDAAWAWYGSRSRSSE